MKYRGIIIEESLNDNRVLNNLIKIPGMKYLNMAEN
jgi:hypothetical protein